MTTKVNNEYGCIEIDKHVIAQIAYRAAMESYGLVGFSQKIKGIVELLKGENADDLEDEIKNQQDGRIAREVALCAGKQRVFYELLLEHRR